jgi:hypothetical protein
VNKNLKSLSLSLSLAAIHISNPSLSQKSEQKSFTKPKKEFEVGTYIRELIGVSDERWSRGGSQLESHLWSEDNTRVS